jgi:hypothetical protein
MNAYLDRLLNSKKGIASQLSKPSKLGSEGFGGMQGMCFSKNHYALTCANRGAG